MEEAFTRSVVRCYGICRVQVGQGSQVDLSERGPERKAEGKPMDLCSVALSMECVCVCVCVCEGQLGFQSETSLCSLLTHNEVKHCSAWASLIHTHSIITEHTHTTAHTIKTKCAASALKRHVRNDNVLSGKWFVQSVKSLYQQLVHNKSVWLKAEAHRLHGSSGADLVCKKKNFTLNLSAHHYSPRRHMMGCQKKKKNTEAIVARRCWQM